MTEASSGATGDVHEERVAFCVASPAGALHEDDVRLLTERLTRGPEGVFDVRDDAAGARLVAALVERGESETNAAALVPLGCAGPMAALGPLLARALEGALALMRSGSRRRLHVDLPSRLEALGAVLAARGLAVDHAVYAMATEDARFSLVEPPSGLRFEDWHPGVSAEAIDRLVCLAFAGIPGFMRMPLDELRRRLPTLRPTPRVLLDGEALVGLARLRAPGEDGVGEVRLLARDPSWRGRRLGDALLTEAMRVLAAAGARSFALEVVTTNASALALYERHGFRTAGVETVWARDT